MGGAERAKKRSKGLKKGGGRKGTNERREQKGWKEAKITGNQKRRQRRGKAGREREGKRRGKERGKEEKTEKEKE